MKYSISLYSYLPEDSNDINGIIHQNIKINVTCSSSPAQETYECENAINISKDLHLRTWENNGNNWVTIHFPSNSILITNYSIQSPVDTHGNWPPPKSWYLYASTKLSDFEQIDFVENAPIYIDKYIYTRQIAKPKKFSHFKFVMNGKNYQGKDDFRFYKIDFFGTLYLDTELMTCIQTTPYPHLNTFYLIFIFL